MQGTFAEVDDDLIHSEDDLEYGNAVPRLGQNFVRGVVVSVLAAAALVAAATWGSHFRFGVPQSTVVLVAVEDVDEKKSASKVDTKEDDEEDAMPPCKMEHADDEPSMFCWSVMFDDDKDLIKSQFKGRAGIFACNDFMVIGQEEISLGKDDCGVERKTLMKNLPKVSKGMYGVDGSMTSSWLNVPIFLECWDEVIASNKVWENAFTVKVDPDTVFFPGRLGYHMKKYKGKPIYTTDCRYWGGDTVGKLFGSVEVVSMQAIGAYKGGKQKCKDLPWQGWGEDYWLQHCMDAIGVPPPFLIADWVADTTCPLAGNPDCSDKNFIANHPHKDAGDWWSCWKQSNGE